MKEMETWRDILRCISIQIKLLLESDDLYVASQLTADPRQKLLHPVSRSPMTMKQV